MSRAKILHVRKRRWQSRRPGCTKVDGDSLADTFVFITQSLLPSFPLIIPNSPKVIGYHLYVPKPLYYRDFSPFCFMTYVTFAQWIPGCNLGPETVHSAPSRV